MAPKILITTTVTWPSAARYAAGFGELGARVDALYPGGHVLAHSRYVNRRHAYFALTPLRSLETAVDASDPDLIVPCDDRAVLQLLALYRQSRDARIINCISRSLGAPENYRHLIARCQFIVRMRDAGIRAPETLSISSGAGMEGGLQLLGLPAVVKSDQSWGGDGIVIARTREDARSHYRRLATPPSRLRSIARAMRRRDMHFLTAAFMPEKPQVSLQRFVSGHPATTAFACWEGEILGAIHADVIEAQSATAPACVVEIVADSEMDEAARRVASMFHLSGLHGLDYIRDGEGRPHLIEINPRATQIGYMALGAGQDLLAALMSKVKGVAALPRRVSTTSDTIALFPQEWLRDSRSPHLAHAFHDVPWNDPGVVRACLNGQPAPAFPAEHGGTAGTAHPARPARDLLP